MYGAIEAGGTKFICAYGTGPEDILVSEAIPTGLPKPTLSNVLEFFKGQRLDRVGIACFGPLDIRQGRIGKTTPKIDWRGFKIQSVIEQGLGCPAVLDTDVNGAAVSEQLWGAARNSKHFVYVTVGTGIGGGAIIHGQAIHGLLHPEIGHMKVRRFAGDEFQGNCPTHGDCLEGLAAGPAIAERWGVEKAELLPEHHLAWAMTAHYLGQMVVNLTCAYSPELLILGGGIALRKGMLDMVKQAARQEMNGYAPLPKIVKPKLGARAGVLGALALAQG